MKRRLLAMLAALLATFTVILGSASPAAATEPPSPPWEIVASYWNPGVCGNAGSTGVQAGQWQQYICNRLGYGEPWDLWVLY